MTENLDLIKQTFGAVEQGYDTEPVVNMDDPMTPRPTPGFFRRKSSRPPAGSLPLFELDDMPARSEYDH